MLKDQETVDQEFSYLKFQITQDKIMKSLCVLDVIDAINSRLGDCFPQLSKYQDFQSISFWIKGLLSYVPGYKV
jgi:hypothetical protein